MDRIWSSWVSFVAEFEGEHYIIHRYEFPLKFIMQSSTIVKNLAKLADYFWIMHIGIFLRKIHLLNYDLNSIELITFILRHILSTQFLWNGYCSSTGKRQDSSVHWVAFCSNRNCTRETSLHSCIFVVFSGCRQRTYSKACALTQ